MGKNLFLDDTRIPQMVYKGQAENWHLVMTYQAFVDYLNAIADLGKTEEMPKLVSFDYMLDDVYDGADCAKFLVDFCLKYRLELPECNVHSTFPNAKKHIMKELCRYAEITGKDPSLVKEVRHNF